MRRFLLIAICSLVMGSPLLAQQITNRNSAPIFWVLDVGGLRLYMRSEVSGSIILNGFREGPSSGGFTATRPGPGNATIVQWNTAGLPPGRYTFTPTNYSANNTGNSALPPVMRVLWTNNGVSIWEPETDPVQTNSFEWTFGPEWAGTILQVKATNGTVLGTWGLPSVIASNYVLSSSIVTNQSLLNGAQVWLDGFPASVLAMASTNSNLNSFGDRPGYSFEFDSTYQAGEWRAVRPDGSIAASGGAASLGTALTGRVTVAEGQSAEIYTRVPAGDGMGSVWLPTGVTLQGSGITSYTFINSTNAPSPTPMPTPAPVSSPTPGPTAPTTTTNTTPAVTNPTNSEDYVTVDVGTLELEDADDGDTNVISGIGELQGLVQGIVSDMAQTQANFMNAADELNGLRLGGVGKNCTFQFGPANIQLQTSGAVRTGLTLLVIGMAGFVAAGMLRNAVQ